MSSFLTFVRSLTIFSAKAWKQIEKEFSNLKDKSLIVLRDNFLTLPKFSHTICDESGFQRRHISWRRRSASHLLWQPSDKVARSWVTHFQLQKWLEQDYSKSLLPVIRAWHKLTCEKNMSRTVSLLFEAAISFDILTKLLVFWTVVTPPKVCTRNLEVPEKK